MIMSSMRRMIASKDSIHMRDDLNIGGCIRDHRFLTVLRGGNDNQYWDTGRIQTFG